MIQMKEELKELGLTDNEVKIYLALLRFGSLSPSEIAEKTGFSRSYVYDALERLLSKGMISLSLRNNKKCFSAVNPRIIEELVVERMERIRKIIPELESLQGFSGDDISVELLKGKYVYKILLRDIVSTLNNNSEVLIFGIDDDVIMRSDKHYLVHLKQYFLRLRELNIREKVIIKKGNSIIKEAKTTKYRFLPRDVIGNTAFEVYGNKVAIFLWASPNHLILINNKEVANSYRKQFNILWWVAENKRKYERKQLDKN